MTQRLSEKGLSTDRAVTTRIDSPESACVGTGDRVLLAADLTGGVLVAYPLPLLDRLLADARPTAGDHRVNGASSGR